MDRVDEIVASEDCKVQFELEKKKAERFLKTIKRKLITEEEREERFYSFYSNCRDDAQDAYLYRHSFELWKENLDKKRDAVKESRTK